MEIDQNPALRMADFARNSLYFAGKYRQRPAPRRRRTKREAGKYPPCDIPMAPFRRHLRLYDSVGGVGFGRGNGMTGKIPTDHG